MLKEKIAVVTGASRGIGQSISRAFADHGAVVYGLSRSGKAADYDGPGRIISRSVDICDQDACKKMFMEIHKEHKSLDILVNNAGVMEDALIGMITPALIEKIMSTNVVSLILLTQLAARFMSKQGRGSIINLASIVGTNGNVGQSVYSASKGAVISFTKSAAKELAPKGIRANAIAPGIIETSLLAIVPPLLLEKRVNAIGMGRIGTPEDVAGAALFLASDLSEYVSGQVLGVDGCTVM